MNRPSKAVQPLLQSVVVIACLLSSGFSMAAELLSVDDTTISSVVVDGGADSANSGTTCIRITGTLSSACTNGLVGIRNNNKQLIATALLSKATASKIGLYYYENASETSHCPGQAITPCSVVSIETK
ncbi:MAG: hypothetical protein Q7S51_03725 [Gallionellaceae bacterium]|nr:hypothetical protein [Gallionellaceae bacterium]